MNDSASLRENRENLNIDLVTDACVGEVLVCSQVNIEFYWTGILGNVQYSAYIWYLRKTFILL